MSILEGITEKTTKATLLQRLREASKRLSAHEDERVGRMAEIEERVRTQLRPVTVKRVIISSTPEEWKEAVDFLENFEGYLPSALVRVLEGGRAATEAP